MSLYFSNAGTSASGSSSAVNSSLRVNVPSDLEGVAYIQVIIQKEQDLLSKATLSQPSSNDHGGSSPSSASAGSHEKDKFWQMKLEAAQNVLFCKELFAQLAKVS